MTLKINLPVTFACYMKAMYTEHWEKAGRPTGSFSLAELAQLGQVEHFQSKVLCMTDSCGVGKSFIGIVQGLKLVPLERVGE